MALFPTAKCTRTDLFPTDTKQDITIITMIFLYPYSTHHSRKDNFTHDYRASKPAFFFRLCQGSIYEYYFNEDLATHLGHVMMMIAEIIQTNQKPLRSNRGPGFQKMCMGGREVKC